MDDESGVEVVGAAASQRHNSRVEGQRLLAGVLVVGNTAFRAVALYPCPGQDSEDPRTVRLIVLDWVPGWPLGPQAVPPTEDSDVWAMVAAPRRFGAVRRWFLRHLITTDRWRLKQALGASASAVLLIAVRATVYSLVNWLCGEGLGLGELEIPWTWMALAFNAIIAAAAMVHPPSSGAGS